MLVLTLGHRDDASSEPAGSCPPRMQQTPSGRMAARSTAFGPCRHKGRTSRSAAASVGRWDIFPGQRRVPPYVAHRRFARRLSVPSGRQRQRQGALTPCHFQRIAHRGACGKTRVGPQNRRPDQERRRHGATTCVCCCRRTGDAVTNRWWDWRCDCGRWARRCACARRPTGRGEGSER